MLIATIINAVLVALGGLLGVLFKKKINTRYTDALMAGLALVVAVIGITSAITTKDILGLVVCMVVGMLVGEWINIEKRLDRLGDFIKKRVMKNREENTFTQAFVASSLLFCVGSMAIMGALEAGVNHNYTIILSKSVIDCIAAVSLSTALGIGVSFAALPVFAYQGLLTIAAVFVSPFLSQMVINEMSAVGGLLIIAVSVNMLGLGKHIRVANMLPAMFLPIVYQPLASWIKSIL